MSKVKPTFEVYVNKYIYICLVVHNVLFLLILIKHLSMLNINNILVLHILTNKNKRTRLIQYYPTVKTINKRHLVTHTFTHFCYLIPHITLNESYFLTL